MCTNQQKVFTNSRYISKTGATRLYSYFACGYCSECIQTKKNEWRMRAYYEAKDTFYKGGFVLFDTLTYKDECIKYFHDIYKPALYNCWDFFAFSRDDVKRFFKRLRQNLTRDGYDCKDKLRYLLTSEYGDKNTHRSHYHVLFFVNFKINPLVFSSYVSRSWHDGFTDGVQPYSTCQNCPVANHCNGRCLYKSRNYVQYNRVFLPSRPGDIHKVVNYVTKYITKDLYTFKKLEKRVYTSFTISNPNWQSSYSKRLEYRRFKNQVLPFHVQSLGFGLSAIKGKESEILKHGVIKYPVNNAGVVAAIPLPAYFKRKLLFNHQWFNGEVIWHPNQNYYQFYKLVNDRSINNLAAKMQAYDDRKTFDYCLNAAKYHLNYSGVYNPDCLTDDDYLKSLAHQSYRDFYTLYKSDLLYYNFSRPKDGFTPDGKYLTDKFRLDYDKPNICHTWSQNEFLSLTKPFKDNDLQNFVDSFLSWLAANGDSIDFVNLVKSKQQYRYKQLDLL